MPVGWGVMLVEYSVPMGVSMGRPPANGLPPLAVWQATQSPARARSSPCVTSAGSTASAAYDRVLTPRLRAAIRNRFMLGLLCLHQWTWVLQVHLANGPCRPVGQRRHQPGGVVAQPLGEGRGA